MMNQLGPKSAAEQVSNKACDACRLHKVRCLPNNIAGAKICQRCARTDRQCIFTAPQKRKQRKRTDTRVAELEKEVSAMKVLFGSESGLPNHGSQPPKLDNGISVLDRGLEKLARVDGIASECSGNSNESPGTGLSFPPGFMTAEEIDFSTPALSAWTPSHHAPGDVIERGILSMEEAEHLFESYGSQLVVHYPAVLLPNISAGELRRTKPTLFLAVIAASAGQSDPHLYSILHSEVLSAYAQRTVIRGEKSLELVQAMIITSIWYFPPGKFAQLKFYEYIHMAVIMALDIGLGTNPNTSRSRQRIDQEELAQEDISDSIDALERKRTFLVCYMISTGVSLSTHRPNMLRWNDWIAECLEYVATSSNISKFDKVIVAWVRLLKISGDFATSFSFDNSSTIANLSESRVRFMVDGFEKSLGAWRLAHESECENDALMLQFHHSQLYLHELALHDDHLPQDFQPPFNLEKVLAVHIDSKATSSHVDSVATSIASAHGLLDILLSMEVEYVRALPVYNFVRMAYCFITLIKIYISTKTPGSHIGAAVNRDFLRVDFYLQSLIDKSIEAAQPKEYRAPYAFLGLLIRLQTWFKSQESEKVFTPPQLTRFDDCWLPPVPVSRLGKATISNASIPGSHHCREATINGEVNPSQFEQVNTDQHKSMNTAGPYPTFDELEGSFNPHCSHCGSNELDIDHLMSLGGVNDFKGQDLDWLSDLNTGATFDLDPAPNLLNDSLTDTGNPGT